MSAPVIKSFLTEEGSIAIPVSDLYASFQKHFTGNKRILFSGKFGVGKTYFLNEFFHENESIYDVFHLYPINYQVSQNEDIFKLLKYDILVALIKKNPDIFSKSDVKGLADWGRLMSIFYQNNKREIHSLGFDVATSVSLPPIPFFGSELLKLGRPLSEVAALIDRFIEFKDIVSEGESGDVGDFFGKVKKLEVVGEDYISHLIRKKIRGTSEKKSVLVLDDLDRIDPEHIFRVFNVFSAHFDEKNEEFSNKFGFDKIIFVCDYDNIESIFHHRYGSDADFSGYIDKFFESEIFNFNNDALVKKYIEEIIERFNVQDENVKAAMGNSGFVRMLLQDILSRALTLKGNGKLTIRKLLKPQKSQISSLDAGVFEKGFHHSRDTAIPQYIGIVVNTLISLFGGKRNAVDVLEKINANTPSDKNSEEMYRTYSEYLLEMLGGDLSEERTFNRSGRVIEIIQGSVKSVKSVKGGGVGMSEFMYDLLVEYVSGSDHF